MTDRVVLLILRSLARTAVYYVPGTEYRRLSPFEKMVLNVEWRRTYPRAYRQTSSVPGICAILLSFTHGGGVHTAVQQ